MPSESPPTSFFPFQRTRPMMSSLLKKSLDDFISIEASAPLDTKSFFALAPLGRYLSLLTSIREQRHCHQQAQQLLASFKDRRIHWQNGVHQCSTQPDDEFTVFYLHLLEDFYFPTQEIYFHTYFQQEINLYKIPPGWRQWPRLVPVIPLDKLVQCSEVTCDLVLRCIREWGQRWHHKGWTTKPEDIFYLEWRELNHFLRRSLYGEDKPNFHFESVIASRQTASATPPALSEEEHWAPCGNPLHRHRPPTQKPDNDLTQQI